MKDKIISGGVIVAIIVSFWALHASGVLKSNGVKQFGATAAGGMLAENYIPYVLYNGGYNSAKDFTITGGAGITLGSSGTTFTRMNTGQCYIMPTATTIAATTTVSVDCQATLAVGNPNTAETALTGVTSGDTVVAQLSTTTAILNGNTFSGSGVNGGLVILGASPSTTAGYIVLRLYNAFGATYTYPTFPVGGVNASGTVSYIVTK